MHRKRILLLGAVCVALPIALSACKRGETPPPAAVPAPAPTAAPAPVPFRVSAVDLGNAIGPDKRVTMPSATFTPTDTIFVSVASDGSAPSVNLAARFLFEDGQVVNEQSKPIAPTGPAVTEFHIAKPDGWPAGRYKVEISANGAAVGAKEFEVK